MFRTPLRRLVARAAVGALAVAAPVALTPTTASAVDAPSELFFSEYVEGSSNNKALEVYNGTGSAVDLAAGGYAVTMYFNGSTSTGLTLDLTGSVADGDVYVLAQSSASAEILAQADQTSGSGWFNGDDAITLVRNGVVVDSIGQIGVDPGSEWGSGDTSTADNTLRRTVCAGDADPTDAFDPATEWAGFPRNTFDGLGSHTASCGGGPVEDTAPGVAETSPSAGSTLARTQDIRVSFTEPVTLAPDAVSLSCTESGHVAVSLSPSGTSAFYVDPGVDLVDGETCTLGVVAGGVSDLDGNDPPDGMDADYSEDFAVVSLCTTGTTTIPEIQGSGARAAVTGPVDTRGVVTADYEGRSPNLRGFYLQDATGDGDPATSDGIFVFNGNNDSVSAGDVVGVRGSAEDYQDQTQIGSVAAIERCGSGTVAPTTVKLPVPSTDYYERYEGMLVRYEQTLYVTEHYQLGRFGQVTVSSGDRLRQPTNVVEPGAAAKALQAENERNRVIVDDTRNNQNPDPIIWGRGGQPLTAENTLRGGDTVTGATGIMTYTWAGSSASGNAWRLRPLTQSGDGIEFEATDPRPTDAPDVGGAVQVAGMNLLNYFNTFSGCTGGVEGPSMDCRGADTQTEFDRQKAKTVAALTAMDADVIGVNEIENDGYGPQSAIATLVDALNDELGAGTYAFIDADAATGQVDALGDDAIKVGFLYQPASVTPVGDTAVLNTEEFVNAGEDSAKNRPSLAQSWRSTETGGVFTVDVNHLKSKGSACDTSPDTGDGQGNCSEVRLRAARLLVDWLATDPTHVDDADVLLVGDYNSYAKEDPIRALEDGGFTNLVERFQGEDAYSYVFDGQWGYLDQAMGSATMTGQVTGVADVHINADEPSVLDYNTDFKSADQVESLYAPDMYRVSDHDPVLVGITPARSYGTDGLAGPLSKPNRSVKAGSTLPVKAAFTSRDGSAVTDIEPFVTVRLAGEVVLTGSMTYVDGYWQYLVRTGDLPDPEGAYEVTVLVPSTGQYVTATFVLR